MQCGKYKGSDPEQRAKENSAKELKRSGVKSLNLLSEQYDKLSAPDNMIMKGLEFEQENNTRQFQQQQAQLNQNIGRSNLAGSGSQAMARKNLAEAFQSKQDFTREKAADEQASTLDKLTAEMQNIISTTRASLAGLTGDLGSTDRDFNEDNYGNLSNYGIDD